MLEKGLLFRARAHGARARAHLNTIIV